MSNRKRSKAAILLSTVMCMTLFSGCGKEQAQTTEEIIPVTYETMEADCIKDINKDDALTFWYTDDSDTAYFEKAAEEFETRYGVPVECVLYEELDYLEAINQFTVSQEEKTPDLFVLSNSQIQKAYMAGFLEANTLYDDDFWAGEYPVVTKKALTLGEKQYGYPLYFDTCFLVYDSSITTAPATVNDILTFTDSFEDNENQREIFAWDLADPGINYMFLGAYAVLFGENGDDINSFDITNENVAAAMTYYQTLSEYFSLDVETGNYDFVKAGLTEQKLIYAICKTDMLSVINSGENQYQAAAIPNLTEELASSAASTTYTANVNVYGDNKQAAHLFAAFLSYEYAGEEYALSGKLSTRQTIEALGQNEAVIYNQYVNSNAMPKALQSSDFWNYSEIMFYNIWNGEDVQEQLQQLYDKVVSRF